MTILATPPPFADHAEIPADRLCRLSPEQFRAAVAVGAFPPEDRVVLSDGLLRVGGADGPPYRLTLARFHRLYDVPDLERVELLGGWLVARAKINPPHRIATRQARVVLERLAPADRYYVDQCAPSSMPLTDTEPLPDVQVVRGLPEDYPDRHPAAGDVALLVEVADATRSFDRNFKLRLYAAEGVEPYWLLDIVAPRLEVYAGPSGPCDRPGYASRIDFGPNDEVPLVLDGVEIGRILVRDLLP